MTDNDEKIAESVRESKVGHAIRWLNEQLRAKGGPHPGRSAIVVITLDDVDGKPDMAYVNCRALPDLEPLAFAGALEDLAKDIRANNVEWTPHKSDDVTH